MTITKNHKGLNDEKAIKGVWLVSERLLRKRQQLAEKPDDRLCYYGACGRANDVLLGFWRFDAGVRARYCPQCHLLLLV